LPYGDPNIQFQVNVEVNADKQSVEYLEYLDGVNNIGVSTALYGGNLVASYAYPQTNELISIKSKNKIQQLEIENKFNLNLKCI
jgi:hypothetical protein